MSEKHFVSLLIINSGWNEKMHLCNVPRKNAVGKRGLMYTSVREKLGLKTIKMADGLANKYNNGKRYLILTLFLTFIFFLFFIFHACIFHACIVTRVTRMARTLARMARMTRMPRTLARMARIVTRMARWLAH